MNDAFAKSIEKPDGLEESSFTGKNTASTREKMIIFTIVFFLVVCLGCLIALFLIGEEKTLIKKLIAGGVVLLFAIWLADTIYKYNYYANVTLRHVQWVLPEIGEKLNGGRYTTASYSLYLSVNVDGSTKEVQTGYIFKKGRIYPKCLRISEVAGKPQRAGYDARKDCWIII